MFGQRNAMFSASMLIAALAGIWTLVHVILGLVGITANDYWNVALLVLFVLALILAFVQYASERSALQTVSSNEQFPEPAISRFFTGSTGSSPLWFVVRMYVCWGRMVPCWLGKGSFSCLGNVW